MATPHELLEQNRLWSERVSSTSPELFDTLAEGQSPEILWIGCADSRVPASQIVDCAPGELFVHRNVANLMVPSDPNGLSVLTYAVEELEISHIIVCGHYGCGGVKAVLSGSASGVLEQWLEPIEEIVNDASKAVEVGNDQDRWDRYCELNVEAQVDRLAQMTVVQEAWEDGRDPSIHGWIYRLSDGRIHDLDVSVDGST